MRTRVRGVLHLTLSLDGSGDEGNYCNGARVNKLEAASSSTTFEE